MLAGGVVWEEYPVHDVDDWGLQVTPASWQSPDAPATELGRRPPGRLIGAALVGLAAAAPAVPVQARARPLTTAMQRLADDPS